MEPLFEIIDVSEHNSRKGKIDWEKVKESGIKGVIIRIGWAGYDGRIAANNALDDAFEENILGAHRAGLDVGLYVYSYTRDPVAARIAAEECVEIAKRFPQAEIHYDGLVDEQSILTVKSLLNGNSLTVWLPLASKLTNWVKVPTANRELCDLVKRHAKLGLWILKTEDQLAEAIMFGADIIETTGAVKPR